MDTAGVRAFDGVLYSGDCDISSGRQVVPVYSRVEGFDLLFERRYDFRVKLYQEEIARYKIERVIRFDCVGQIIRQLLDALLGPPDMRNQQLQPRSERETEINLRIQIYRRLPE